MSNIYNSATIKKLDRLGNFFQLHRQSLKEAIKSDLLKAESEFSLLIENENKLKDEVKDLVEQVLKEKTTTQRINAKLQETSDKLNIVTELLATKPNSNTGVIKYKELLNNDLIEFSNQDLPSNGEADVLLNLQKIGRELELLVGFPEICNKNIVAIGGGFSSGKSEFVNSFINSSIRLAVGLNPVTAIPSYVLASSTNHIRANTTHGGFISLDINTYKQTYRGLSHDYIKSFGFNLKMIMPFISIGVAMEPLLFSDICLIDTPGYNSALEDKYTTKYEDRHTAIKFIDQSKSLIWIIGLDAHGTFDQSSLNFIDELDLDEKELFIIINKADLRAESELEDIFEEIEDALTNEGLNYIGISAYSSITKKEYSFRKQSLFEFLKNKNQCVNVSESICSKIDEIFNKYYSTIENDIRRKKDVALTLKSMLLDTMQFGDKELYDRFHEKIDSLREISSSNYLEERLNTAKSLCDKFKNTVYETFEAINSFENQETEPTLHYSATQSNNDLSQMESDIDNATLDNDTQINCSNPIELIELQQSSIIEAKQSKPQHRGVLRFITVALVITFIGFIYIMYGNEIFSTDFFQSQTYVPEVQKILDEYKVDPSLIGEEIKVELPDFVENESYARVRIKMIDSGWAPVHYLDADSCTEMDLRCKDRPEMKSCAGVATANCKFLWKKNEKIIALCTFGEDAIFNGICSF